MGKLAIENPLYGVMAEFDSADALMEAATKVRDEGYKNIDAYSPFPIEGLTEALGTPHTKLPFLIFCGGLTGALTGFALQYWTGAIDYPINVGGRPLFSWPAWIPIIFECTILFSAFTAVFGVLGLSGLPRPYHPVFNVEKFASASRDGFFLCIESKDPKFDQSKATSFLKGLKPKGVYDVAA